GAAYVARGGYIYRLMAQGIQSQSAHRVSGPRATTSDGARAWGIQADFQRPFRRRRHRRVNRDGSDGFAGVDSGVDPGSFREKATGGSRSVLCANTYRNGGEMRGWGNEVGTKLKQL